ncbi:MAG: O-antigen ligase family protein [Patescibacteria group bacterium]
MDNTFRNWLLGLSAITLVSLVVFRTAQVETVLCGLLVVAVFVLALRRLEYGVLALIAEIFTSGNGHLLELHAGGAVISLRMGLFGVVMLAWIIDVVRKRRVAALMRERTVRAILAMLAVIMWGLVNGAWIEHLPIARVLADGNNWLYFAAVLPVFDLATRAHRAQWFSQVSSLVRAGVVFLCAKAWLIFVLTAGAGSAVATYLYHFVRQTSGGQIAPASYGMWRIYEWPQLILLPVLVYLVAQLIVQVRERAVQKWTVVALLIVVSTVVLTLFRSFWLGAIAGLGCMALWYVRKQFGVVVKTKMIVVGLVIASTLLIMGVGTTLAWLHSGTPSIQKEIFTTGEPGVQNRVAQAGPMWTQIKSAPILGSGFGTAITYESTDLREQGQFTTAALELGWLDMWMEVGMVGVLVFVGFLVFIFRGAQPWVVCSVIALVVVHLVSPFLNHPVGIAILGILFVYSAVDKNAQPA